MRVFCVCVCVCIREPSNGRDGWTTKSTSHFHGWREGGLSIPLPTTFFSFLVQKIFLLDFFLGGGGDFLEPMNTFRVCLEKKERKERRAVVVGLGGAQVNGREEPGDYLCTPKKGERRWWWCVNLEKH